MKLMAADYSDSILGGVGEKKQKKNYLDLAHLLFFKNKKRKKNPSQIFL